MWPGLILVAAGKRNPRQPASQTPSYDLRHASNDLDAQIVGIYLTCRAYASTGSWPGRLPRAGVLGLSAPPFVSVLRARDEQAAMAYCASCAMV